jgi:hypothetical protein
MNSLTFSVAELHKYPIGLNEAALLEPETLPNMLDLTNVERTFLAENKQYWAHAARANFIQYRKTQEDLKELCAYLETQAEPLMASQIEYKRELEVGMANRIACFKEANKRRKTGFAVSANNVNADVVRLKTFYRKLWAFVSTKDNHIFRSCVVEAALNVIRVKHYYYEPAEKEFGIKTRSFIKEVFADINFCDCTSRDLYLLMLHTEMVAKALHRFVGGKYVAPSFDLHVKQ